MMKFAMEQKTRVLVVGSGGREHAIVDALARSEQVGTIYCAPGNAGIARQATCVPLRDTDVEGLLRFAREQEVGLTVVGPEAALAVGIVDRFRAEGLAVFGPTQAAARIESSKEFAKELMRRYDIPTAGFRTFTDFGEAWEYVSNRPLPAVLKYDGLAAGKGVVIAETLTEAETALREMLEEDRFGKGKVVVEDFLTGPEFSLLCFVAGEKVCPMVPAQDHKRAFDGDAGPNTGGMGAYSPLPFLTQDDIDYAVHEIMEPTARAMAAEGCPFTGVLYGGLMKTPQGIKVIEFNARFGDPETEVVLPRMKSDFFEIARDVAHGTVPDSVAWHDFATLGIVLASKGYPGSYPKGLCIEGTEAVEKDAAGQTALYHMGTARNEAGELVTAGGRVLFVLGRGASLEAARADALDRVAAIRCEGLFHRSDIGHAAVEK